jgi:hypothetical protein
MSRSCYSKDALESRVDLERLGDLLAQFRDRWGRPACLTTNMVMANPDFEAIRENDLAQYVYEPVWRTWERSGRGDVAQAWHSGMAERVFVPQFHAREHVCWWKWLDALRAGDGEALLTFDLGMCGVPAAVSRTGRSFYCYVYADGDELTRFGVDMEAIISEGLELFASHFGYQSVSTIAPNVTWTDMVEGIWARLGVKYIQGGPYQLRAVNGRWRVRGHFLGQRSTHNGRYLVRNCVFEPCHRPGRDSLGRCLREVSRAFRARIPAVIGTHRVNYIGSIDERNRGRGLMQLQALLGAVRKRWPDVHFLSTPELASMIERRARHVADSDTGLPNMSATSPERKRSGQRRSRVVAPSRRASPTQSTP